MHKSSFIASFCNKKARRTLTVGGLVVKYVYWDALTVLVTPRADQSCEAFSLVVVY
jgi:hypothetical protein